MKHLVKYGNTFLPGNVWYTKEDRTLYTMEYRSMKYADISVHKKVAIVWYDKIINFSLRDCLRFCFLELIQKDLDKIQALHNQHHIRVYPSRECPSGRPELIYNFPQAYGVFGVHNAVWPNRNSTFILNLWKKKI